MRKQGFCEIKQIHKKQDLEISPFLSPPEFTKDEPAIFRPKVQKYQQSPYGGADFDSGMREA